MPLFKNRLALVVVGTIVALLAGLGIAAVMVMRDGNPAEPPPASQGGLIVQTGRDDDVKLDERRPLRCFVNGQLIGDFRLSDCARRNGVASGALDVGLDASGALAAGSGGTSQITPLPPSGASPDVQSQSSIEASAAAPGVTGWAGRTAGCWLYADSAWGRLPADMTLTACLRALYGERCAGGALPVYGRWADRTLRLLEGRIEISPDNRTFHVLAERNPACGGPQG